MRTIKLTYPHILTLEELPETVCAIGFFDGIHKGHQKVIQTAIKKAKANQMESAVITFHPHPSVVLDKGQPQVKYITPMRRKQEILQQLGVDRLYVISFNHELASLTPQQFIDHFIIGLNIKHLVAGFDFTYGHKGQGNMDVIAEHAKGAFTYTTIDEVQLEQEKISSTKIRKLLASGDVETVKTLLGRPLTVTGVVIKGDQRGQSIGYPTANIQVMGDVLLPKSGVYAVKVVYRNECYEGMANLGTKPTFTDGESDRSLEVNILDYNNDLYGEELTIEWHTFIRDEIKFSGVSQLVEQISQDEQRIRSYFLTKDRGEKES
ncbi:MAG TPA: bifunctional riboflavin kinase/FAD synthetase [Bacillota bacterium]|nr:bifunctional riboflavin kinase/FAD synthetase [Bacillota bacterium]